MNIKDASTDRVEARIGAIDKVSELLERQADMIEKFGEYNRRRNEWDHQRQLATAEMAQIDTEKKAAETRRTLAEQDLTAHLRFIDGSNAEGSYLFEKYTNKELYDWHTRQLSSVYFAAYDMALRIAKQAERCFSYELSGNGGSGNFIKPGYWDSLKSGLLSGEQLANDLNRMKAAYMEKNAREYELRKDISLLEADPQALAQLRTAGSCFFPVSEELFDIDTPGHYLRRNKSVALTIKLSTGGNSTAGGDAESVTAINAKLTLVSHRYRATPTLLSSSTAAYREKPGSGDPRFVYNMGTSALSIVTSTSHADGGFFSFRSEERQHGDGDSRYLPFERTGAVGVYSIELPRLRRFDYGTIRDVVLHVAYTARDGGATLREAVVAEQTASLNTMLLLPANRTGMFAAWSLARDAPTAWESLTSESGGVANVSIPREQLPYFVRSSGLSVDVSGVVWVAETQDGHMNEGIASFNLTIKSGLVVTLMWDNVAKVYRNSTESQASSPAIDFGSNFTLSLNTAGRTAGLRDLVAVISYKLS